MGINILGMGRYLPEQTITNADFEKFVETDDEWIRTRTGISERRMAGWEPSWYMGSEAAKQAVERAGINPEEIGVVICCTITSDFLTPSMASIIQHNIGAKNAMAFDLNAACTGFVYGVDTAKRFLDTDENMKYALVVSTEALSRFVDFEDRGSCILFGDGSAAAVIEKSDKIYSSYLASDGSGAEFLMARSLNVAPEIAVDNGYEDPFSWTKMHKLMQNGKEVYKFATSALPKAFEKAAEKIGVTKDDISWFIPHQANVRIIETAAKKLGVSMDKFIVTLDKFGNTSSASIPMAMVDAIENGTLKRGQKIALIGFGAGLTYGGIVLEY
ncbi:MAG: ketoacyl-ACP synthase III [Ruminococcus sp.]|nr:ketoacyl-ACP synthase III [Ruminococcus sp.]